MSNARRLAMLVQGATLYGREVIHGALAYCRAHALWDFMVETNTTEPESLAHLGQAVHRWKAQGVIAQTLTEPVLRYVTGLGVPTVEVSGTYRQDGLCQVHADNRQVGRLVARHFLENGLKHFAFSWVRDMSHFRARYEGFAEEIRAAGFDCINLFVRAPGRRHTNPLEMEEKLVSRIADLPKPIGVMGANDFRARDVVIACQQAGVRVPDEVSVVGVDNDETTCATCPVPISSVDVAPRQIGWKAAAILDGLTRGEAPPPNPALVTPVGVIVRASSEVAAMDNRRVAEAIRFIRRHAHEPIDVRDVLKAVPISRRGLETNFRRILGRTPSQQVFHERVELAKRLLVETDLPMAMVAAKSGFSNASVFAVIFKRTTGVSPSVFRRTAGLT